MKCFMTARECEYSIQTNPCKVFVMTPFEYPFDDLYVHGIKPLLSQIKYRDIKDDILFPQGMDDSLQVHRADQAIQLGFVMCQAICKQIRESNWIIADITKPNRNVFYELGLSFGMNKQIILLGRSEWNTALHFGLLNEKNAQAYIKYSQLKDFSIRNPKIFIDALQKPIINRKFSKERPKSKIFNIISAKHTVKGLHEKTLNDAITEISLKQEENLLNKWEVSTESISEKSKVDDFLPQFLESKVCTIDTTSYNGSMKNPYPLFCLGLGHALERETIPITHVSKANILPFDVRGLYHIFFDNLSRLKEHFTAIIKEIDKSWHNEKEDYAYIKFWNNFFKFDNNLHIMTCARGSEDKNRPDRTNIDKWDYITVSELTRFISLKFPNSRVHITRPINKLLPEEIKHRGEQDISNDMERILENKDCIIVGSPDVSDLAEIILSKINNVRPYQSDRLKKSGFVIIKSFKKDIQSSFIWIANKDWKEGDGVGQIIDVNGKCSCFENISPGNNHTGTAYGICIITKNPFSAHPHKKTIMIFSGFTGIATYGIAKQI